MQLTRTNTKFYYRLDGTGSIVAAEEHNSGATQRFSYGPFGESATAVGHAFRFTGRRIDDETGLYYYRARMYSPALGRFMQTDPIGYEGGLNLYAYVSNDPLNLVDPMGLAASTVQANSGSSWSLSDVAHGFLTAGSFLPGLVGSAFSATQGILYAVQGNQDEALLTFGAAALGMISSSGAAKAALTAGKHMSREARWLQLANAHNSRLPKEVIDHVNRHGGRGVADRFGLELAHRPKKAAAQGHDYSEAIPKTAADHRGIQHRYLRERSTGTSIAIPNRARSGRSLDLPPPGSLP